MPVQQVEAQQSVQVSEQGGAQEYQRPVEAHLRRTGLLTKRASLQK